MTIAFRKLRELILFVDVNLYQSEHRTSEVKPIADLAAVLRGFGFTGLHSRDVVVLEINGHNFGEIRQAWNQALESAAPTVILAKTQKGGGSKHLLETHHANGLLTQEWHTKVPLTHARCPAGCCTMS